MWSEFLYRYHKGSLAEDLSISFLRLSTHTSVKKTEMVQNRTFPDLNRMNDETKVTTFPLRYGK